ncbi:MAG: hypothetical protein H0W97_09060 [Actinobacteria bacterium]|nr:hypothetical protein [Actinomycetota bacterium]
MAETAKRKRPREAAPPGPESHPESHMEGGQVCTVGFCPICLAVTAVQPLKPEAVEHLLKAGREFLLAMTAVLGARADEAGGKEKSPTLTRIDIE